MGSPKSPKYTPGDQEFTPPAIADNGNSKIETGNSRAPSESPKRGWAEAADSGAAESCGTVGVQDLIVLVAASQVTADLRK